MTDDDSESLAKEDLRNGLDYDSLRDAIEELMTAPDTDDPMEVLQSIATEIGIDYSYFDGRGVWVPYPPQ